MSKRGTEHFNEELHNLIDRYRAEYEMTYAEIIGSLTIAAIALSKEKLGEDDDD